MLFKVNLYSTLRELVGAKTVEIELDAQPTLRQMVADLAKRYPALGQEILDASGDLQSHIHIFVNGRQMTLLEKGLDTKVTAENKISIFPPVGGG